MGATIKPYSTDLTRPLIELTRMAPAVPTGTAMITTAIATSTVLRNAIQMRLSFHIAMNHWSVKPFHGMIVGSLLSLNAAPPITSKGSSR